MTQQQAKPIGEIVLVQKAAYQVFSETWNGKVRFFARVGKPFIKKDTGEPGIVAKMEADSASDFVDAALAAKAQLDQIRNAAFQREVDQQRSAVRRASLPGDSTTSGANEPNEQPV